MDIYIVKQGDTVYSVAAEYGVSADKLIAENMLQDGNRLAVGQTLVIQQPLQTHTVQLGETLMQISRQYGVTVDTLLRNNPELGGRDILYPGQVLTILLDTRRQGVFAVNGYAYTFVDKELLRSVLPYLTYLTVFTYGMDEAGNIYAPQDEELIALAEQYGVAPVMHISTLQGDGYFDNRLSEAVLTDAAKQEHFVEQVLQTMKQKRYRGLDIDFEFVPAAQAEAYAALINRLRMALMPEGKEVIVALAPKTSTMQKGLLYEGHLYKELGEAADRVLLMTYEWGYTYGPPMAVAPIDKVEQVVRFGVGEIPRQKIYMGFPTYGYDWTLPYTQGRAARSLAPQEAVELAIERGAQIQYDTSAQAPYFYYEKTGSEHVVWFEDARSAQEKYALAAQYGLYGVAYWNLMRPFPQNWLVLNNLYEILKV